MEKSILKIYFICVCVSVCVRERDRIYMFLCATGKPRETERESVCSCVPHASWPQRPKEDVRSFPETCGTGGCRAPGSSAGIQI